MIGSMLNQQQLRHTSSFRTLHTAFKSQVMRYAGVIGFCGLIQKEGYKILQPSEFGSSHIILTECNWVIIWLVT